MERSKASGGAVLSVVTESLERTAKDYTEEQYLQAVKEFSVSATTGEVDHPRWIFISNHCHFPQLARKQYALYFQECTLWITHHRLHPLC